MTSVLTRIVLVLASFITLSISKAAIAQKTNSSKPPKKISLSRLHYDEEKNHECVKKNNRSFSTRLKNYPFYLSTQIQIVSFIGISDTAKGLIYTYKDRLPMKNDTVDYASLYEIKTLNLQQIDQLTDILYNYAYAGPTHIGHMSMCFYPRNAILFLDSLGKVFEYIEICFECDNNQVSSEKIVLGDACNQKMDMIKEFFRKAGITYGLSLE